MLYVTSSISASSTTLWCEYLAQELGDEIIVDPEFCSIEEIKGCYYHPHRRITLHSANAGRTLLHECVHAVQCKTFRLISADIREIRYWCSLQGHEPDESFLSNWKRFWEFHLEKGAYKPEDEELELPAYYVQYAREGFSLFKSVVEDNLRLI